MIDIQSAFIETNGQQIHYTYMGDPDRQLMLMLHGFPEFSAAWEEIMPAFADDYFVIAPDQRGYNLSSRPSSVSDYRTGLLVGDMLGLIAQLSPAQPIILCGHDWGAAVAYALAMRAPERVTNLIIANGVHPAPFQKALLSDPAQIEASQYINGLRRSGVEDKLRANDFERLLAMFSRFSPADWMSEKLKKRYVEAWGQPGSLTGMVNWYRASQIIVPDLNEDKNWPEVPHFDQEKLRIKMPHLLIWGMNDQALLPTSRDRLDDYCDDLTLVEIDGADHWLLHSHPERVISEIKRFLAPS